MLLTVDIGNTNITMALIDEDCRIHGTFRVTTKSKRTSDEYGMKNVYIRKPDQNYF